MTATPEMIVARREIIALLVATGGKGLALNELIAKVCKRVKGLSEKDARAVITSLAAGGAGRGVPQIHKKTGRWQTDYRVAPAEVKLIEVTAEEAKRTAATRQRTGLRDQVLTFLEDLGAWATKQQLVNAIDRLDAKMLRALIDEKLVTRIGATKSTRYSATSLQLDPPEKASPATLARKAAPAPVQQLLKPPSGLSTDLKRALDRLDAAIEDVKKAAKAA